MLTRLLKSTVVAAVFGFVATLTVELAVVARVAWRFHTHTAIAVNYIHFASPPFLISALVFAATVAYCLWLFRGGRLMPIPLLASLFGFATVGGVASAVLSTLSRQPQEAPIPMLALITFFASCFAVIGFYGGLLGGAWLRLRFRRIHSTGRLLLESAVAGIIIGALSTLLLAPLSAYGARSDVKPHEYLMLGPLLFCAAAGCVISLAFALTFRRRLITPSIV